MKIYCIEESARDEIQRVITDSLKEKEEIIFAYLHGSFLEGQFRDIDIAIYLARVEQVFYALSLESELEEIVRFPVDIRILNQAPPSFRFRVIGQGVILFDKDENRRCDFECRAMAEYHDYKYHLDIYRREALGLEVR